MKERDRNPVISRRYRNAEFLRHAGKVLAVVREGGHTSRVKGCHLRLAAINPERERERLRAGWSSAAERSAKDIFAVDWKAVRRVQTIWQTQSAEIIVGQRLEMGTLAPWTRCWTTVAFI
jgi:hypothetical protein